MSEPIVRILGDGRIELEWPPGPKPLQVTLSTALLEGLVNRQNVMRADLNRIEQQMG